jgi:hypothetical protein
MDDYSVNFGIAQLHGADEPAPHQTGLRKSFRSGAWAVRGRHAERPDAGGK